MSQSRVEQLHGVWAAQPVAWDDQEQFDAARYESDIAYLCSTGIHGIYSGGTTGEFYALDFEEFVDTNALMLQTAHAAGVPVQVGVTALCTREVERRTRWATEHGADGIQVALPFWLPLSDGEVLAFFRDVGQAAAGAFIVHYDTLRSKRSISTELYCRIKEHVPNLVGSKYGGELSGIPEILRALPGFAIFTGEPTLYDAMKLGASGTYSSVVLTNPHLMLAFFDACRRSDDVDAQSLTTRIKRFKHEAVHPLLAQSNEPGYWDSALDRLQAMLNPHMKCGLRCRRPYRSASPADLQKVRTWIEQNDPGLLCG